MKVVPTWKKFEKRWYSLHVVGLSLAQKHSNSVLAASFFPTTESGTTEGSKIKNFQKAKRKLLKTNAVAWFSNIYGINIALTFQII